MLRLVAHLAEDKRQCMEEVTIVVVVLAASKVEEERRIDCEVLEWNARTTDLRSVRRTSERKSSTAAAGGGGVYKEQRQIGAMGKGLRIGLDGEPDARR